MSKYLDIFRSHLTSRYTAQLLTALKGVATLQQQSRAMYNAEALQMPTNCTYRCPQILHPEHTKGEKNTFLSKNFLVLPPGDGLSGKCSFPFRPISFPSFQPKNHRQNLTPNCLPIDVARCSSLFLFFESNVVSIITSIKVTSNQV